MSDSFLTLKNINKKFFIAIFHSYYFAETERFELSIELPLYTLSRRAPSATRTRLQQFNNSTIPQFHNSTIPQFHNSTIPQFHNSTIPQFHNSTIFSRQKYSFKSYIANIFSAFSVVTRSTSSIDIFFTSANFSTTYFK
jgi:hypothetical protein